MPLILLAFCITFEKIVACISIAKIFSLCLEGALLCGWQLSLSNQTKIGAPTKQGWAPVYVLNQRLTLDVCCGMPNRSRCFLTLKWAAVLPKEALHELPCCFKIQPHKHKKQALEALKFYHNFKVGICAGWVCLYLWETLKNKVLDSSLLLLFFNDLIQFLDYLSSHPPCHCFWQGQMAEEMHAMQLSAPTRCCRQVYGNSCQ